MNTSNMFEIGVVYYAGLGFSLLLGFMGMIFLSPNTAITRIAGKANSLWCHNFKITVIFSGILGAMSISFTSCKGGLPLGLDQLVEACVCSAIILTAWFIIFLIMRLLIIWRLRMNVSHRIFGVILAIIPIGMFYLILYLNKWYR